MGSLSNHTAGLDMLAQLKFFAVTSFYLGCNFMPVVLLLALYKVVSGSVFGLAILLVCVIDLAIPLKFPGFNLKWCEWTDESVGKSSYFPAECVIETDFKRDKNYLVRYNPPSVLSTEYLSYCLVYVSTSAGVLSPALAVRSVLQSLRQCPARQRWVPTALHGR